MNILMKFLQLRFIPASIDLALLVLRLWVGGSMLFLHGWPKLVAWGEKAASFADPFGIGAQASYALALLGEVGGSVLLIVGLFTRLGAALGAVTMGVAFFVAHGGQLSGAGNGELAFLYLGAYVTLLLAGGGFYAADIKIAANRTAGMPKSV
ncbi:DoxX family protein [Nibricoccus aquaticus]|uniref:DoxX family protein n=1 Tax=Nibricoccus aquaticus TaxID=2576891 RepID=A0A290Q4T8_9BACT|nr:DoxX family protein [Nibricoccus aquaticus]ATC63504.1 DoxX family protein [Nibricoccus aquaticus]